MMAEKKNPFSERRIVPRCEINTEVKVLINSQNRDQEFSARSLNISLQALAVSCHDALIHAILAQNIYPHECEVELCLPGESSPFRLQTQVVTHRRLSQLRYQLVLRFGTMNESMQEKLLNKLASLRVVASKMTAVSLAV